MTPDQELEILKRDAYEAGFKAYLDGQSCLENPFRDFRADGPDMGWHWEEGWRDGAAAFRKSRD